MTHFYPLAITSGMQEARHVRNTAGSSFYKGKNQVGINGKKETVLFTTISNFVDIMFYHIPSYTIVIILHAKTQEWTKNN